MGAIPEVKMRQKTETRQVYNEELGCYEWKEVETDKYVFDETDKIAIAREYHERRCPASEIVAKYHISSAVVVSFRCLAFRGLTN